MGGIGVLRRRLGRMKGIRWGGSGRRVGFGENEDAFLLFPARIAHEQLANVSDFSSAELFWTRQFVTRTLLPGFFRGSFASNGVWTYQEHVALVRGLGLPRERLLEWSVRDGWQPLCEFLGNEVPDQPFPNGNPTTEWAQRVGATLMEYNQRALRNMAIAGAVVVGGVSLLLYFALASTEG